jgi:hypothetical protein
MELSRTGAAAAARVAQSHRAPVDRTVRTAAQRCKTLAVQARVVYDEALPGQRSFASVGHIPPVTAGEPARPLLDTVGALSAANASAAVALDVGGGAGVVGDQLVTAADALTHVCSDAVAALHDTPAVTTRVNVAHAAARSCYAVRDALAADATASGAVAGTPAVPRGSAPAWWRALADPLVEVLARTPPQELDAARMAAGAAHHAAEHLMWLYVPSRKSGRVSSALLRCARATALAAEYAAWSACADARGGDAALS